MLTCTIVFNNITIYFQEVLNSYHLVVDYVKLLLQDTLEHINFPLIHHINNINHVTLMILLMDNNM
jgi:hypothetical protein